MSQKQNTAMGLIAKYLAQFKERAVQYVTQTPFNPAQHQLDKLAKEMQVLKTQESEHDEITELGTGLSTDPKVRFNFVHEIFNIQANDVFQPFEDSVGQHISVYTQESAQEGEKIDVTIVSAQERYATVLHYDPIKNLVEFLYGPYLYVANAGVFMQHFQFMEGATEQAQSWPIHPSPTLGTGVYAA